MLRAPDANAALDHARILVDAGLDVIELTTTVPGWEAAVETLRREFPDVCVGVGTVTDADLAGRAVRAGGQFCVSPAQAPEARGLLVDAGMAFIEGGMTPTEVLGAAARGLAKLFPAHVGGPTYLRSLLAVAPTARIIPTGGIQFDEVTSWLDAGAVAVGIGSNLAGLAGLRTEIARLRQ